MTVSDAHAAESTSVADSSTGGALVRAQHHGWRSVLGWPGRFLQRIGGSADVPQLTPLDPDTYALSAAAAPRGNAYLGLEPGLRLWQVDGGHFAVRTQGRTAFIIGGLLAEGSDAAVGLPSLMQALRTSGVRRMLMFPILESDRQSVHDAGFRTVCVGSEAAVELSEFTLAGKEFADLRQMRNRASKRHGLRVEEIDPPSSDSEFMRVYRAWLGDRPSGYAMSLLIGTPNLAHPCGRRYFVARNNNGAQACATIVPGWNGKGWGVDVMARIPNASAGAMDLLLSEIMLRVRAEGASHFTLSACPMAGVELGERPPWHLAASFDFLYRSGIGNRLFGFQDLHRFKAKFRPKWAPVYIAAWPTMGVYALYEGCRMWGLFGPPT